MMDADPSPPPTLVTNGAAPSPLAGNGSEMKAKDSIVEGGGEDSLLLYDVLYELCQSNIEFFAKDDSMTGSKIHAAFLTLSLHIGFAKKKVAEISSFAHEYDYDEHTKGNGYRSFVIVVDCCIRHSIKLCRNVQENRNSLLFRKSVYFKEVSS